MTHCRLPKIAVRDLSMSFPGNGNGSDGNVLENIKLDVREGEFVCIVGPSGCGKTTLLNVVGGFLSAASGSVFIDGTPMTGPDRRRIFVFQENGVFPWLTVEQNIGFGLVQKSSAERRSVVAHYIEMVGLTGFEKA